VVSCILPQFETPSTKVSRNPKRSHTALLTSFSLRGCTFGPYSVPIHCSLVFRGTLVILDCLLWSTVCAFVPEHSHSYHCFSLISKHASFHSCFISNNPTFHPLNRTSSTYICIHTFSKMQHNIPQPSKIFPHLAANKQLQILPIFLPQCRSLLWPHLPNNQHKSHSTLRLTLNRHRHPLIRNLNLWTRRISRHGI
jgi:hypothetical protein